MEQDPKPSFSWTRRWSISLNLLLSIAAVVALVLMVNYLAARHFERIPVSTLAQQQLSPQTRRVLDSVTNNVHVTIYFDREDPLYELINSLLKEYKFANPRIGVETVEFQREPAEAQRVKIKYKLPSELKNLVIFECNGNRKVIYEKELSDLDLEPLMSGRSKEVRRSTFKGELLFTSAIYSVTSPRVLKAYFLGGHGEHSPESTDRDAGFSKFATLLKDNNIEWAMFSFAGTNDVPADCSLLVMAGVRTALTPQEMERIDAYLRNGGRALVMFNWVNAERGTGLESLLGEWGVDVARGIALDRPNSITGQDLKLTHFGTHPISAPLIGSSLHMVYPRAMRRSTRGGQYRADAPNVAELAFTGPEGTLVTDFRQGLPYPSPGGIRTNYAVAIAVEKGKLQGLTADRGTTRLVVLGDSIFLGNNLFDSAANQDFASLAVNWLLDRSQLLGSLAPRPIVERRLGITKSQMTVLRRVLLLGMPGAVLLLGTAVWARRRS